MAATTTSTAETFNVAIGGSSPNGNIASYNYYPDVVTIDAGDTVTWHEGPDVHTVMIAAPGATLPPAGSPKSLAPAGGTTFDGTSLDSSGILLPGKTYSLKFTKPGIYQYQCGVHPDMVGVVVVQPSGTTRPFTPSQVLKAGEDQLQVDLSAGEHAKHQAHVTVTPGAKGTKVYHVATDLPSPNHWSVPLSSATGAEVGTAALSIDSAGDVTVKLSVMNGTANASYTSDIQVGSAATGSPVADKLNGVTTNSKGVGTSTTVIKNVGGIPGNIWFIDLMSSTTTVSASGQVNYPQYGALRYFPQTLTIHAGDSVIWTQNDYHEAHTITILKPGQTATEADKYEAKEEGGNVVTGPGFYNSGLLWHGQTYELTFDKAGTYQYLCLLHDDEGMLGTVKVLPTVKKITPQSHRPVTHYTVRSGDSLWGIAAKELGNGNRWHELYAANRSVIGQNANVLRVPTK